MPETPAPIAVDVLIFGGGAAGPPGAEECGDLSPDSEVRLRFEAAEAVESIIRDGLSRAMNTFNERT